MPQPQLGRPQPPCQVRACILCVADLCCPSCFTSSYPLPCRSIARMRNVVVAVLSLFLAVLLSQPVLLPVSAECYIYTSYTSWDWPKLALDRELWREVASRC